jgi:hypothetical protein
MAEKHATKLRRREKRAERRRDKAFRTVEPPEQPAKREKRSEPESSTKPSGAAA